MEGEMTCTFLVIVAYLGDLINTDKYFPAGKKEKAIDICNNRDNSRTICQEKKSGKNAMVYRTPLI